MVVSPDDADDALWINQDVYFAVGSLEAGTSVEWKLRNADSGVYVFVIEGTIEVAGETLERRDGIGISEISDVKITAGTESSVLLMEVPMR